MRVAQVVGQVVSTAKQPGLASLTLLLVAPVAPEADGAPVVESAQTQVAVDLVGAGLGELVLLASGSAARLPTASAQAPTDLAVVAIVDSVNIHGTVTYSNVTR